MLRSLLADRFKLNLGHQTKELPVYALVVASGRAKLTPTASAPTDAANTNQPGQDRLPGILVSPGRMTARAMPMSFFADVLGEEPELGGRLVLDETGIKGKYDFTLHWAAEGSGPWPANAGGTRQADIVPAGDSSGPSIFTAIREQLGLKLEPTKGPVEILRIDNIERPSEN
jgi:uncharacterized protein (TIGR03435 family)